jgi:hypothetical protein
VSWELAAMDKADCILFHFLAGSQSPITLMELGLYADSKKVIVSCEDGFWRKGNVEIVCEKYSIPMYNTLDGAYRHALKFLKFFEKRG